MSSPESEFLESTDRVKTHGSKTREFPFYVSDLHSLTSLFSLFPFTTELQPLLGRELLHPTNETSTSSSPSTYNVFSEQEKAFFKRSEALQQLPGGNRSQEATVTSTSEGVPKCMKSPAEAPIWGFSKSNYSADTPSKSSLKYDNIPPYRATTSANGDEVQQSGDGSSNQFGVLVPGWGPSTSGGRGGVSDLETKAGASMQFVPVITKGTGAPGRGPTKRKKP